MEFLQRYCALVDDGPAFLAAAERQLPAVVWANPLQGDVEVTAARLLARCPDARPLGWRPHAWRLPTGAAPGTWPEYMQGLIQVQEEAALWAAPLLDAQPGEAVFDLCAAPGNKTAQLAVSMQDTGLLWANDRSPGRLIPLRRTLERLGVTCVATLSCDAVEAPGLPGSRAAGSGGFDRVLADVPCTCEGTSRKLDGRRSEPAPGGRAYLQQLQVRILRRGLELLRPGGTLVYCTCTYAPEENECVLDTVPTHVAVIEPAVAPSGLRTRPGLDAWDGHRFRPDMGNALRLWPQDNDTGGFFAARLRRL